MKRLRHLRLTEYETAAAVQLDHVERDALRAAFPSLAMSPSGGFGDRYDLTPGHHVGVMTHGAITVEVRPKLPVDRLMFLISYAIERIRWSERDFDYGVDDSLFETMVAVFVRQLNRALTRGLLQGYRTTEEALLTVRGRIRIEEQIRRRHGTLIPVEVRYDDFTVDIDENRLLRSAVHALRRIPLRSPALRRALRQGDFTLQAVTLMEYGPAMVPEVQYSRLNEHYRHAVELARLILRAGSVEATTGAIGGSALVVDMNKVFEDFVVAAIRDELGASPTGFRQGSARGLALDIDARVALKPDMSLWENGRCLFLGDVKYKKTRAPEVPNADLYQALAYCTAADLGDALLIYAAGEDEPFSYTVKHAEKRIHVVALDLAGPPEDILDQVHRITNLIRALRRRALHQPAVAA